MTQQDDTILNVTIDSTKAEEGAKRATGAFERMFKAFNDGFERFRQTADNSFQQAGSTASRMFSQFQSAAGSAFSSALNAASGFAGRFSASLRSVASNTSSQFGQLGQIINGLGSSFNNLIPPVKRFGSVITGVFTGIGSVVATVSGVITGLFTSGLLSHVVEAGLHMQKFRSTMTVVTGSVSSANVQLGELRKTTDRVGISFEQAAGPFAKFAAAAQGMFTSDQTNKIFAAFSEASSALKLNQQEIQGVFLALQQMASKGKVSMEELRLQLAERIPGAMQLAAQTMGVTIDQLESDIRQGKVNTEDFLVGFAELISEKFGGAAMVASSSAIGAISRLKNAIFDASVAIADAGLLDSLSDSADRLAKHLNDNKLKIEEFGRAFGDIIRRITDGFLSIKPETVTKAFDSLISAVRTVASLVQGFSNSSFIKWMNGDLNVQKRATEVGALKATLELVTSELTNIGVQIARTDAGLIFNPISSSVIRSIVGVNQEYSGLSRTLNLLGDTVTSLYSKTKDFFSSVFSGIAKLDLARLIDPFGVLSTLFEKIASSEFYRWLVSGSISKVLMTDLDLMSIKFTDLAKKAAEFVGVLPKRASVDISTSPTQLKSIQEQINAFSSSPISITTDTFGSNDPRFKQAQDMFSIGLVEMRRREEEALLKVIENSKKALSPNREMIALQERRNDLVSKQRAISEQLLSIDKLELGTQKTSVEVLRSQTDLRLKHTKLGQSILDIDEEIEKINKRNSSEYNKQLKELEKQKKLQEDIWQAQLKQIDALNRAGDPTIELTERLNTALSLSKVKDPKTGRLLLSEKALQKEIDEVNKLYKEVNQVGTALSTVSSESETRFDAMAKFADQAARNIQSAFSNFFFDPFEDGLEGLAENFTYAIRRLVSEAAALDFLKYTGLGEIFGGTVFGRTGPYGTLSGSTPGANGFTRNGSALMDLADVAALSSKSMFSGSLFTSFAKSSVGQLLGLSQKVPLNQLGSYTGSLAEAHSLASAAAANKALDSASTLTSAGLKASSALSAAAKSLMAAGAGIAGGSMIAGDKKIGGLGGTATSSIGSVVGAAIGSVVPGIGTALGAFAGGIVGGLVNKLFGLGPEKRKETTFTGTLSASGLEDGTLTTHYKRKGGLFRSSKHRYETTAVSSDIDAMFDQALQQVAASVSMFADNVGLDATRILSFSKEFKVVSEKGKPVSTEQIEKLLVEATDEMIQYVVPGIEQFKRAGETLSATIERLNQDFDVLVSGAMVLGNTLSNSLDMVKNASISTRSEVTDAFGGAERLDELLQVFASRALTRTEQTMIAFQTVDKVLSEVGLSANMTRDQFKALVKSFDDGGISLEVFRTLLEASESFFNLKDAMDELNLSRITENDIINQTIDVENDLASIRAKMIDAYRRERSELKATASGFTKLAEDLRNFRQDLLLGELSPLTPGERLAEARSQFDALTSKANAGDQDAMRALPDAANAFLQASQLYNASSSAYTQDFDFVQSVLKSIEGVAITEAEMRTHELQVLDDSFGVLGEIEENTASFRDLLAEYLEKGLSGPGNADFSNSQIRAATAGMTSEQSKLFAADNRISGAQLEAALSSTIPTNPDVTFDIIKAFTDAHKDDPMAIYNAAIANGISSVQLSAATGIPKTDIDAFVEENHLAKFAKGTDKVTKTGIALLHENEAVLPSSVPVELKLLRQELAALREEQAKQTDATIRAAFASQQRNADTIVSSNNDMSSKDAWRKRSGAKLR